MKTLILAAIGWSLMFHRADTGGWMAPTTQTRTLTFADRVAYQHAIEEVYWRHRDWPRADGSSKPSLDHVMSQTQMEKKVEDYLRNSQALEDYWQQPITPKQLQAEMDRMAGHTKRPEVKRAKLCPASIRARVSDPQRCCF
jgi:hypothetical protein